MRTQSAATKLLDHIDGWQKVYADDIATIHVRKAGAVHTAEPAVIRRRSKSRIYLARIGVRRRHLPKQSSK